jgi:hypothetical protein
LGEVVNGKGMWIRGFDPFSLGLVLLVLSNREANRTANLIYDFQFLTHSEVSRVFGVPWRSCCMKHSGAHHLYKTTSEHHTPRKSIVSSITIVRLVRGVQLRSSSIGYATPKVPNPVQKPNPCPLYRPFDPERRAVMIS